MKTYSDNIITTEMVKKLINDKCKQERVYMVLAVVIGMVVSTGIHLVIHPYI